MLTCTEGISIICMGYLCNVYIYHSVVPEFLTS